MRFIDLFAGIGGIRIGFESEGYRCVFSSEIDKDCRNVYMLNYNELPFFDVSKLDSTLLPDFDILTAGFPCQPFSISGNRRGFDDIRGTLFFEIVRIIKDKCPPVIMLENVKNLIYHDSGRTIGTILSILEGMDYFVSWKLLNAKDFGLPQNRERIIIIASKNKLFDFSKLIRMSHVKLESFLDQTGSFEYLDKSDYTLIDNPREQESGLIFVGYRNKNIRKKGIRESTEHLSRVHRQPNRIYSSKGVHPTITSQEKAGRFFIYIPEEDRVRKLTIDECYRLMGYPTTFIKSERISEAYKQIGNSVAVPMIKEIANSIRLQGLL